MKRLFEPVRFDLVSLPWNFRNRTEHDFKGFYHWHQCCEMLFVHEGQGTVVVDQQTYQIRRGMLFFFQPFQLHHVYADVSPAKPYIRTIIYLDPIMIERLLGKFPSRQQLFTALWQNRNKAQAFDLFEQVTVLEWIFQTYADAVVRGRGEEGEEITLLMLQVLNGMMSAGISDQVTLTSQTESRRYSEAIMRWIEDHYGETIRLNQLAEEMHLSKFYISRVFSEETGSSLTDYITARRIKQACRLLETTTMQVELIGNQVGFPNSSYFVRLFKKVVGTTPLKFRNHMEPRTKSE